MKGSERRKINERKGSKMRGKNYGIDKIGKLDVQRKGWNCNSSDCGRVKGLSGEREELEINLRCDGRINCNLYF